MKINNKLSSLFILGSFVASLPSCSHGPEVIEFSETANVSEEVAKLENDVQSATDHQLDVLAPKSFNEAHDALNKAREGQQKVKDPKDILHKVAVGRAYLNQANQFGKVSKDNLEQVIAARKKAIKSGAPRYFPKDFKEVDKKLTDATSDVEKNDLSTAEKNHGKLLSLYLDLELRSMKKAYLGQARETIDLAIKEGAEDYATQSLAIAQKKVKDTDAFIIANRHAVDQIYARSIDARKSADHLLKITREAKAAKKITPEEIALRMEKEHNRAEGKAGLEGEVAFNEQFEEARAQFTESEAEVYKQGNNLLIRLKDINFPVGQSVILASNFPLLTKVQHVIKGFGNPYIVIEGHTDSTGGKTVNDKISAARAEAIKSYLLSTGVIQEHKVRTVGYGFQKPLVSNKTPEGKAQNRRVDIIITPEKTQEL